MKCVRVTAYRQRVPCTRYDTGIYEVFALIRSTTIKIQLVTHDQYYI